MRRAALAILLLAQQLAPQCGGGTTATDANSVAITVSPGAIGAINEAFVSVTVCVPGQTSNCQTVDNVLVDTGSSGLRLLDSAVTLPLTQQSSSNGNIFECFPFQDGYTWGPVVGADVTIGSKTAAQVPIQIVSALPFPAPPAACTNSGPTQENTPDTLGANGVLGVGLFRQDCGLACSFVGSSNPALYFACASNGTCQVAAESLTQQLQNPVWMFPNDNNGIVLQFPPVNPPGQAALNGTMIFGIGTQSNNALGSATIFTVDAGGNFTTTLGGTSVSGFIDAGSNGLYFLDAATAGLPTCSDNADFYCPASTVSLSATNLGANGRSGTVPFTVANADALPNLSVLPQLAGPFPGNFDWGLPLFFGRTVFTAIEGQSTPGGTGPFVAY